MGTAEFAIGPPEFLDEEVLKQVMQGGLKRVLIYSRSAQAAYVHIDDMHSGEGEPPVFSFDIPIPEGERADDILSTPNRYMSTEQQEEWDKAKAKAKS